MNRTGDQTCFLFSCHDRDSVSNFAQGYLEARIFMEVAALRAMASDGGAEKHSSGSAEDRGLIFHATMERKHAVAVVFHHIGPYHHARLNAAADRLAVTGVEWSAKGHDAWGAAESAARYRKVSLFPEATEQYPPSTKLARAFGSALKQANPDVVAVNGWNNFGSLIAANCCVRHGIPMVV